MKAVFSLLAIANFFAVTPNLPVKNFAVLKKAR
jgi:hypothetical protein